MPDASTQCPEWLLYQKRMTRNYLTARTASNQLLSPSADAGLLWSSETLGVGGEGSVVACSDTACGMSVGVVVRDSFRRCLGDSGGKSIDRPRHRLRRSTVGHTHQLSGHGLQRERVLLVCLLPALSGGSRALVPDPRRYRSALVSLDVTPSCCSDQRRSVSYLRGRLDGIIHYKTLCLHGAECCVPFGSMLSKHEWLHACSSR
jgi:hypothetical protein